MGLPVELPSPRGQRDDDETSSSGGEDEGWVQHSDDDDEAGSWADPSGGVLSQVFDAAEAGDAGALADLLQGLDVSIDTRGADSDTAIHLAALYGHADCVRLLLEAGARADVADADGALPVHDAAAGGYADICALLLDAAPHTLDRGDSEGDTPLHNVRTRGLKAARGSHADVVQLLLDRGADCTLQNDEFKTPAQLAERGSPGRQLLEEAQRRVEAERAAAEPQQAPPAAEVA